MWKCSSLVGRVKSWGRRKQPLSPWRGHQAGRTCPQTMLGTKLLEEKYMLPSIIVVYYNMPKVLGGKWQDIRLKEVLQNFEMSWECKPSPSTSIPNTLLSTASSLELFSCLLLFLGRGIGVTLLFLRLPWTAKLPILGNKILAMQGPNFTSICYPSTKITAWQEFRQNFLDNKSSPWLFNHLFRLWLISNKNPNGNYLIHLSIHLCIH